jgi:Lon protease-like protein
MLTKYDDSVKAFHLQYLFLVTFSLLTTVSSLISLPIGNRRSNFLIQKQYLNSFLNPNDLETPEERESRMKLVRKIQETFYRGESDGLTIESRDDITVLENVPLWRVQWTELPGYQNVLNCHVPHYTHMFRRILSGQKPWIFGHVFLPGGSENLNNPEYALPSKVEQYGESKATIIGTLMRISDYRELNDGRLVLIVQALERFQILHSVKQVPYAIATVQLTPDEEHIQRFIRGRDGTDAAKFAVEEANLWRNWEFRPTLLRESISNALGLSEVSPLVNYDYQVSDENIISSWIEDSDRSSQNISIDSENSQINRDHLKLLEYKVWIEIDKMLRLLTVINPRIDIPLPTQLLGLLPSTSDLEHPWPIGFRLEEYTQQLLAQNAMIGTSSKSRFVSVSLSSHYPPMRRAQRLSFSVWILLESLGGSPNKQSLLEETSIASRLSLALQKLCDINDSLQQFI